MIRHFGELAKTVLVYSGKITASHASNETFRRQEKILNIILMFSIFLSVIGGTINLTTFIFNQISNNIQTGENPLVMVILTLLLLILFYLSKKGFFRFVNYLLVIFFIVAGIRISYAWGADTPLALLIYAFTIILAGVLIGSKHALFVAVFIIFAFLAILHFQSIGTLSFNNDWTTTPTDIIDGIVPAIFLLMIVIVSWLSSREIEFSLKQRRQSENELIKEKMLLKYRIAQRTRELKKTQMEKMVHLYRFADFGRLASGLMHELVNPLTSVTLDLERISSQSQTTQEIKTIKIRNTIKRAIKGTKRMESFIESARKQIQQQEHLKLFSANEEIKDVVKVFNYRTKTEKIELITNLSSDTKIYGNPIKFHQVISNIVSNAFDSYENRRGTKRILVKTIRNTDSLQIVIRDWGSGIAKKNLEKILDPFYTTKRINKGTGIGLSISNNIINKNFNGQLQVESELNSGSTFTITIPTSS